MESTKPVSELGNLDTESDIRSDKNKSKFIDDLGGYETFVPLWQNIVRSRYPKDETNYWHEKRFASSTRLGLPYESIEEIHGIDFLHTVIPQMLETHRKKGFKRKMAVLDIGSGLGFLGDQMRHAYPHDINVFGTSLCNTRALQRKRRILKGIKENTFDIGVREIKEISIPEEVSQRILESIGRFKEDAPTRLLHPNDIKWRSIVELTNHPEFDLAIDTYGELYYSDALFPAVLDCAIRKLEKQGRIYIGDLYLPTSEQKSKGKFDQVEWFMKNKEKLSQKHGLEIIIHHNEVYTPTAYTRTEQTTSVIMRKFR